jgi:hypothetical protein
MSYTNSRPATRVPSLARNNLFQTVDEENYMQPKLPHSNKNIDKVAISRPKTSSNLIQRRNLRGRNQSTIEPMMIANSI